GAGTAQAVQPAERRAEHAQLDVRQIHLGAEEREYGEDRLPICIVEERDPPEHGDDEPLVGGAWRRRQESGFERLELSRRLVHVSRFYIRRLRAEVQVRSDNMKVVCTVPWVNLNLLSSVQNRI